ncbi:Hypothetical predicted protein [Olea europaea subsp. europaea]|uniref:Uncharacterized protein n=1 Tax=Olea europaea subsp. europaea TaxID=158383 RepID=A0A8S0S8K6_OLEEU|nr:Hypothetical predicted protein [Olea europaea subsp. europaea]
MRRCYFAQHASSLLRTMALTLHKALLRAIMNEGRRGATTDCSPSNPRREINIFSPISSSFTDDGVHTLWQIVIAIVTSRSCRCIRVIHQLEPISYWAISSYRWSVEVGSNGERGAPDQFAAAKECILAAAKTKLGVAQQ